MSIVMKGFDNAEKSARTLRYHTKRCECAQIGFKIPFTLSSLQVPHSVGDPCVRILRFVFCFMLVVYRHNVQFIVPVNRQHKTHTRLV